MVMRYFGFSQFMSVETTWNRKTSCGQEKDLDPPLSSDPEHKQAVCSMVDGSCRITLTSLSLFLAKM